MVEGGAVEAVRRPDPPATLTPEQCEVWGQVVDTHPADWFGASAYPVLEQYCRHVTAARQVAALIENLSRRKRVPIDALTELFKSQERESRMIASLATKLRVTPQSTTNHRGNKIADAFDNPWDG